MSATRRHSLRVVVQPIHAGSRDSYRLVAYGDDALYPAVEFPSLEQVEKALRSVAPELEGSTFSGRDDACEASIVFAEAIDRTNMVARDGVEPPTPAFSVCGYPALSTTCRSRTAA
jgi:hypothetical protein